MRESLRELFEQLCTAIAEAQDYAAHIEYQLAQLRVKTILSAGSKLHARLEHLCRDLEDAKYIADAEHQMADARQKYPLPLMGDLPLPFDEPAAAPPKRTRKPKA